MSSWATIADAYVEVDRYAVRDVSNGLPGDYIELVVVDDEGQRGAATEDELTSGRPAAPAGLAEGAEIGRRRRHARLVRQP